MGKYKKYNFLNTKVGVIWDGKKGGKKYTGETSHVQIVKKGRKIFCYVRVEWDEGGSHFLGLKTYLPFISFDNPGSYFDDRDSDFRAIVYLLQLKHKKIKY